MATNLQLPWTSHRWHDVLGSCVKSRDALQNLLRSCGAMTLESVDAVDMPYMAFEVVRRAASPLSTRTTFERARLSMRLSNFVWHGRYCYRDHRLQMRGRISTTRARLLAEELVFGNATLILIDSETAEGFLDIHPPDFDMHLDCYLGRLAVLPELLARILTGEIHFAAYFCSTSHTRSSKNEALFWRPYVEACDDHAVQFSYVPKVDATPGEGSFLLSSSTQLMNQRRLNKLAELTGAPVGEHGGTWQTFQRGSFEMTREAFLNLLRVLSPTGCRRHGYDVPASCRDAVFTANAAMTRALSAVNAPRGNGPSAISTVVRRLQQIAVEFRHRANQSALSHSGRYPGPPESYGPLEPAPLPKPDFVDRLYIHALMTRAVRHLVRRQGSTGTLRTDLDVRNAMSCEQQHVSKDAEQRVVDAILTPVPALAISFDRSPMAGTRQMTLADPENPTEPLFSNIIPEKSAEFVERLREVTSKHPNDHFSISEVYSGTSKRPRRDFNFRYVAWLRSVEAEEQQRLATFHKHIDRARINSTLWNHLVHRDDHGGIGGAHRFQFRDRIQFEDFIEVFNLNADTGRVEDIRRH